jgi:CheY-like chemotaxis protein
MHNPESERRVLLIEDEIVVARMLRHMLGGLGYSVVGTAAAVDEAIQMLEGASIHAAVLDINLDGQLSYPVADQLRILGIPFVFSTGYGGEVLPYGYKGTPVLRKPIRRFGLKVALTRLLSEEDNPAKPDVMDLIFEEIERNVAEASAEGGIVSTSIVVERINATWPGSGLSKRQIEDMVIRLGSKAGAAVEFGEAKVWHRVPA